MAFPGTGLRIFCSFFARLLFPLSYAFSSSDLRLSSLNYSIFFLLFPSGSPVLNLPIPFCCFLQESTTPSDRPSRSRTVVFLLPTPLPLNVCRVFADQINSLNQTHSSFRKFNGVNPDMGNQNPVLLVAIYVFGNFRMLVLGAVVFVKPLQLLP